MSALLDAETVEQRLAGLPGWSGDTSALRRTVKAPSFMDGIRLVDAVAEAAEELDHHPDIDIRWTSITFILSTHVAGGVTDRDFALADRINTLAG
jgi:4a-hydroxytetrahydrobiopterin dehydratase